MLVHHKNRFGPCLAELAVGSSDTELVTDITVAGPGRSGPEIRAALAEYAPAELATFEREFHQALTDAAASYDTGPVDQVLTRWWQVAVSRSVQLSEAEEDQLDRVRAGDFTGLLEPAGDGTFRRVG